MMGIKRHRLEEIVTKLW